MSWTISRTDGPNPTAADKAVSFANTDATMTMRSEDTEFNGVPSRVLSNVTMNLPEDAMVDAPSYIAKAVQATMGDLEAGGRQQLVVPVADEAQSKELRSVAKATGAGYEEVEGNAVLKPGATASFDSLGDSFKMADALAKGYSDKEVAGYLKGKGYDDEQILELTTQSQQIAQAREAGYDDAEIDGFIKGSKPQVANVETKPVTSGDIEQWVSSLFASKPKQSAYDKLTSGDEMDAEDLLASMQVLAPNMASMTTRVSGFFGNQEAATKAEAGALASRTRIIDMAAKRGLQLEWNDELGSFVTQTETGPQPIEEGFWDSFWTQKGELAGGVSGAIVGGRLGAAAGTVGGPWGVAAGTVVGSILGAAAGSATGTQLDYLYQAVKLQEDIEADVMAHKALTAAEVSVVADALGLGVAKGAKGLWRGVKRVKDFVVDGNTKGAYEALKQMEFMSDDQAAQIVTQLGRMSTNMATDKNFAEQAIAATAITRPGAEGLVQAAAGLDAQASRAVAKGIDDRAKDLLRTTGEMSGESLGKVLREDLGNYVADVKQNYHSVIAQAAQSTKASNFRFDYDKLAIDPVLATLQRNIMDPAVLEKFQLQASRIRDMSDGRTFADLLDLRQVVNEFKFNTRISKAKDFEALNGILKSIDDEIYKGAQVAVDKPAEWLKSYGEARLGYAKMKQLEKNVMYKALNKPGANEADVTRNLARYITAMDGTFNDVMIKLPVEMRSRVENSVVDTLANKYTAGVGDGLQAVNFPMLSDELKKVTLSTPQARQAREAVSALAEVFRNDVPLSRITGNIQIPKFQSYLTTDPVARAKYEIASGMFNYVKSLLPSKKTAELALVRKTAKLLENPLNARSVRELMEAAGDKVDVSREVLNLQQQTARAAAAGKDTTMPRVKLYGSGSVLGLKGTGQAHTIPVHRIASTKVLTTLAESSGINLADKTAVDTMLKSNGYAAVQQGTDRIRVLK
ncbi:tail tape measure protein [Edwardsiella phage ETP-1]|uniref:Tail tape measure protein n=3 Tax=Kafunavirus KF1 TaxID=1982588 RepID=A0A6G5P4D2_9CAUD|nr:hypothetical protein D877_gp37 [Edwardsiella phage KF-1]QBP07036.1 tail tape measure protein [Edwardsiella phage ETP-1]BAM63085.1 hypothetical protein [Edwardsiella phage KF-1]BAM63134.1 hypothetical protein [Edwardsiella phage IW-1]